MKKLFLGHENSCHVSEFNTFIINEILQTFASSFFLLLVGFDL